MTFKNFYLKEDETYAIYCDMDGVLTDFIRQWKEYSKSNLPPTEYEDKYGKNDFWNKIDSYGVEYWMHMPWMPDGKTLWNYIKKYNPVILSAPSNKKESEEGKKFWVKENLGNVKLILSQTKFEHAAKNRILIDDREDKINNWKLRGGIGILHSSAKNTIEELKSYNL